MTDRSMTFFGTDEPPEAEAELVAGHGGASLRVLPGLGRP